MFNVENEDNHRNKGSIEVLDGFEKKIKIINADNTYSSQVYGVNAIAVANEDGETINTLWNASVETIDGSGRDSAVGLVGNYKNNLIISGNGNNTLSTGEGKDSIACLGGDDIITDFDVDRDIILLPSDVSVNSKNVVAGDNGKNKDVIYSLSNGGSITVKNIKSTRVGKIKFGVYNPAPFVENPGQTVMGTKNADILIGGAGDDTFVGLKDNDVFVYSGGNDVITDYSPLATKNNGDKISLGGGQTIRTSTLQGSDVILTIGNEGGNDSIGTICVKKGKNKDITVGDRTYVFGNGGATLKPQDEVSVKIEDDFVNAIDASKLKEATTLNGSENDNVITGGNGSDTLSGGAGNDTLTGNKGDDVFVYNGGNDVITDYSPLGTKNNGDKILLDGDQTITAVSLKGNHVVLSIGYAGGASVGTLQINKGKGREITINDKQETYTSGEGVENAFKQVVVLLDDKDSHTKDAAVGGDEGEEHTKCLIEGWHGLLKYHLNHLHQGCNDEDESNGLKILETKDIEHIHLNEVGDNRGNNQDCRYCHTHA